VTQTSCFVVRDGVPITTATAPAFLAAESDPFSTGRTWHIADEALGYGVGLATSEACDLRIEAMPHTEFVAVWEGEIALQAPDESVLKLCPGDCAVIPAGTPLRWVQAGLAVRSFLVFADAADDGRREVILIDPKSPLDPAPAPASDVLLTLPPNVVSRRVFSARSARIRIGLWDATPYRRRSVTPAQAELMVLLAGAVTLTDPAGTELRVADREMVMVPAGVTNAWTSDERVYKIFCIVS